MKSLVFIVEGETELEFINRILIPYLTSRGLNTSMHGVIITMSGGGHGYNNIEHLKNTIRPILHQIDQPVITTMIDHYAINSEKKLPGYTECITENDTEGKLQKMEQKLNDAVSAILPYRFFIPYIQRHELETLLLANPKEGFALEDDRIRDEIATLCSSFTSIEDINSTPEGAPSKRLGKIYSKYRSSYQKGSDAVDIAELTTIESILSACPRFKAWVEKLIETVRE